MPYERAVLAVLSADQLAVMLLIEVILVIALLLLAWWFTRSYVKTLKVVSAEQDLVKAQQDITRRQLDQQERMINELSKQAVSLQNMTVAIQQHVGVLIEHDKGAIARHAELVKWFTKVDDGIQIILKEMHIHETVDDAPYGDVLVAFPGDGNGAGSDADAGNTGNVRSDAGTGSFGSD